MLSVVSRVLPDYGRVYCPSGEGPFPAVLVLHGSEGGWSGWSHRNALLLAAHGFLAYPHAYSRDGNAWNAGAIKEVPLEHTTAALQALRDFSSCSGKVGLYGLSRGAEHALLLTSLMVATNDGHPPDAVAVHSPPDVICGAFDAKRWRDRGDPGWQVWDPADRAWTWHGSSEDLKPTTPIEIERYDGPLFISHGTEDKVWDVAMTRRLEERLRATGRDTEIHYYDGEDHILTSDAENENMERLLAFFGRHLSG